MRVPSSTYRLQFAPGFGFPEARGVVAYLGSLGITDIYASPVFKARSGSVHGYDIVDPNAINPELGGEAAFSSLIEEVRAAGMGWVQDVVSNHLAYDGENQMLSDVMEKGEESRFRGYFDIEWEHAYESIKGRVLAPFLGRIYGEALEGSEITVSYGEEGFRAGYFGFRFPLSIGSYAYLLTHRIRDLKARIGREHADYIKLLGILYVIKGLPVKDELEETYDQVRFVKRMLWEIYARNAEVKNYVQETLDEFNGRGRGRGHTNEPDSFNLLDRLLSGQLFKFSFWKVASREINYRRFFNINGLITLKVEKEEVFDHVHSLVLNKARSGEFTGLRFDHVDGLHDPLEYLNRMRGAAKDAYMVAEKVFGDGEEPHPLWPVQGTTGYDFLNRLNSLFCDRSHEARLTRIYSGFTGLKTPYQELLYEKKKLVAEMEMASDLNNLAQHLKNILRADRYGSDITLFGLSRAITEVVCRFPVYRTYIGPASMLESDRAYVKKAVDRAIARNPALLIELKFLGRVLCLEYGEYQSAEERRDWLLFVMRFQQFTGPLMAKGFEDTLLYVYNRLLSLNEVGGAPEVFGITAEEFHEFNAKRAASLPYSMNATSTHDTKRGEDARARISVISELPDEWGRYLSRWHSLNRKHKRAVNGNEAPDKNDEYFLYQTLIGAMPFDKRSYPAFVLRMKEYIVKAVREAKIHTAWLKPDTDYEDAFLDFLDKVLDNSPENIFLSEFIPFQRKAAWAGLFNSISQTLLKITSPGVPDFYQGSELWDFNLVDPDNRRPVDFNLRSKRLESIRSASLADIMTSFEDGRIKMYVIHKALEARTKDPELFTTGGYAALKTQGVHRDRVVAFARRAGVRRAIIAAPRLVANLVKENEFPIGAALWSDTIIELPDEFRGISYKDAFTGAVVEPGGAIAAGGLFSAFPVSLLLGA